MKPGRVQIEGPKQWWHCIAGQRASTLPLLGGLQADVCGNIVIAGAAIPTFSIRDGQQAHPRYFDPVRYQ